jgi:hypothetical protein
VPGPRHRAALEASALTRVTTEPLLAALLGVTSARAVFDWLRGLSIMSLGPFGVWPHDLVRDALTADLRWRDPARHDELRRRATAFYRAEFDRGDPTARRRLLADGLFVHRDHPIVGGVLCASQLTVVPVRPPQWADIVAGVARHEGPESAEIARHWLHRQPGQAATIVDGERSIGYLQLVRLADVDADDRRIDPVVDAACDYAEDALRARLGATLVRFWLGWESYQDFGPVQTAVTVHVIEHSVLTPNLAMTLTACSRPEDWTAITVHTGAYRVPALDYRVGRSASCGGVFVQDWRVLPALEWLAAVAGLAPVPLMAVRSSVVPTTLTPQQFGEAVRAALRDLNRADRLRDSPLLQARIVADQSTAGGVERVRVLQQVIRGAAGQLAGSPRDAAAYRVVHHTYLQPAPTQRQARELLDLPPSTYRRYLSAGINHLTAILWQQECDAASPR